MIDHVIKNALHPGLPFYCDFFPMAGDKISATQWSEITSLVVRAPCKSSELDPIHTGLVKDCIDLLITPITSIINLSLTEGHFPAHFKSAYVFPRPRKRSVSLNKDSMKNYWPVSNLSFLSKVLEKVVVNKLNSHINSSNTFNQYQSAYRKFHSTEAALLQIHNDNLASMDTGKAFDTVDHTILFRRLDNWFGVTEKALDWLKSYLTGRFQRIRLGDCLSSTADLKFGVPKGSV